MNIEDILEYNGLSISILYKLSYKSDLGVSLKRTLNHFDKDALLNEVYDYADWLVDKDIGNAISLDYRIKCFKSIENKYNRYVFADKPVKKIFNDILGMRAFCDSYDDLISYNRNDFTIADMSKGKANDDGYRGVHIYYEVDNFHYPIEIQFNTLFDRQLNNWLHDYLYKHNYPLEYGRELRRLYENGSIRTVKDFEEALYNGLLGCQEL